MKVLLVNKFLYPYGGSETYVFKLGSELEKMGHEVQYFGMDHTDRCVGNRVDSYTTFVDYHEGNKLKQITYLFRTIYSWEARKKIRRVLLDFMPDVVHLNNFNYQLTPSIIVEIVSWRRKLGKKCRIIYTAHDSQLVCPNHRMQNPNTSELCEKCVRGDFINCIKGKCIHGSLVKSIVGSVEAYFWKWKGVYNYIDTIICCSEFFKAILDCNQIFYSKTIMLRNFVDIGEKKNVQKKNYILYFGRLSKEKGIKTLVDVCKLLPDISFVFAGSGPLENTLCNIKNINYVGFKKGLELEMIIQEALFSVCPSECYENCPFSVLESQMLCTPVIGSNLGGIPELINEGKTGDLFWAGNKEDLKNKIEKLWSDSDRIKEYSINCENIVYLSSEQYCERIIESYMLD